MTDETTTSDGEGVDPEVAAMTTVLEALKPLAPDARERVADWIGRKLGISAFTSRVPNKKSISEGHDSPESTDAGGESDDLPAKAKIWLKQYDVPVKQVEEVFHIDGGETSVILSEMPGKNDAERSLNAYLFIGIAQLLKSGAATFADKEGRELCASAGCYDATNHAKRIKGSVLAGSKEKGWTVTGPGLKRAAELIKSVGAA